jgi:uncharacterized protein Yka (UPF0111/DUF47 family)
MADVTPKRWFLPEEQDVLGLLSDQLAVTTEGVEAFAEWAGGGAQTASELREIEDRGDLAKRDLLKALQTAFVTPLEPEDLFTLSRGIDWILNGVSELVGESEVLEWGPDPGIAELAGLLAAAVHELDAAIGQLGSSADRATAAADRAIGEVRGLHQAYYRGLAQTLEREERDERIALRELYRRLARIGETVVDVAERVVYAVVKES